MKALHNELPPPQLHPPTLYGVDNYVYYLLPSLQRRHHRISESNVSPRPLQLPVINSSLLRARSHPEPSGCMLHVSERRVSHLGSLLGLSCASNAENHREDDSEPHRKDTWDFREAAKLRVGFPQHRHLTHSLPQSNPRFLSSNTQKHGA